MQLQVQVRRMSQTDERSEEIAKDEFCHAGGF